MPYLLSVTYFLSAKYIGINSSKPLPKHASIFIIYSLSCSKKDFNWQIHKFEGFLLPKNSFFPFTVNLTTSINALSGLFIFFFFLTLNSEKVTTAYLYN
jgi:hypothetical protein